MSWAISWVPTGSPFGTHTGQTLVSDGSQLGNPAGIHIVPTWAAHLGSMWACHGRPAGPQLATQSAFPCGIAHMGPTLCPQKNMWASPRGPTICRWTKVSGPHMGCPSGAYNVAHLGPTWGFRRNADWDHCNVTCLCMVTIWANPRGEDVGCQPGLHVSIDP